MFFAAAVLSCCLHTLLCHIWSFTILFPHSACVALFWHLSFQLHKHTSKASFIGPAFSQLFQWYYGLCSVSMGLSGCFKIILGPVFGCWWPPPSLTTIMFRVFTFGGNEVLLDLVMQPWTLPEIQHHTRWSRCWDSLTQKVGLEPGGEGSQVGQATPYDGLFKDFIFYIKEIVCEFMWDVKYNTWKQAGCLELANSGKNWYNMWNLNSLGRISSSQKSICLLF